MFLADRCNATFGYCHEMSSVCLSVCHLSSVIDMRMAKCREVNSVWRCICLADVCALWVLFSSEFVMHTMAL